MLKKVVSLILFFSLFFMMLTALVVFIEPSARVASWSNWTFLGLSRPRWDGAHLGMGLLFVAAAFVQLMLNREELFNLLRNDDGALVIFTKPFLLGLAVTVILFAGALAGLPPVGQLVALSGYFKERAEDTYGEPPYSMAERSTLENFARRMGMDGDKALALLRLRNIKAESASLTLAEIARQNGVAPGGVFEALRMVMEPSGGGPAGLPKDPPPGLGRRKLSDICEEYGLEQASVMARLAAAGLRAQPAWTLAETAKASNVLPIVVYEALRSEKTPTAVQVEVSPAEPAEVVKTPPPAPVEQYPAAAPPPAAPQPATQAQPAAQHLPPPVQPVPSGTPVMLPGQPLPAGQPASPAPQAGQTAQPGYLGQPAQPGWPAQAGQPGASHVPAAGAMAPPPGLEKTMLQTFCRERDIPLSVAVQRLARHRITAFGDMSFEELALENNRTPADVMRLVVTP